MSRWTGIIFTLVLLAACSAPTEPSPVSTGTLTAPAAKTPAVSPSAVPIPNKGGDLREAIGVDAKSFHVYQTTDASSRVFQDKVYASGLWARDPKTLQPSPGMAETWTISSDGRTFTFKLRQNLKWSDGSPLTSDDFAWTFSQASNPANKYPYVESLRSIQSYKPVDDYTIEVTLREPLCTGLTIADGITPLPRNVWNKLDWGDPGKNPEIMNPTVVSGVFKLKEWKRDDSALFVPNDNFYRGKSSLDSDTLRIVPNPSTQLQMLKNGQVDSAPVSISEYAEAKKSENLKAYEWEPVLPDWDYVGFNLRRPFLRDVLVRNALSYATPRQMIADKVFQGLAKPTYSTFAPTSWAYNPDVPRYDYNIDTAKATLQKAGYKQDSSGKLLDRVGKLIPKLRILYNLGNKQREQIAAILQDEFKKLGIDSEVNGVEFQAYLDYLKKEPYDYDLYILGWRTTLDPYFSYQLWSEAQIPALNSGAYVNKQVEKLFDQANHPPCDTESRKKVFQQIQQLISADSPYIFLAYRTGYTLLNKRLVPNEPSPLGISYFPEQWYLVTR